MLVVTLTSWPKRINNLIKVLDSVLRNTVRPDHIYVNLSVAEFPLREQNLPQVLRMFIQVNPIVTINWVDGPNTLSFKKITPILNYLPDDALIINLDDDFSIPSDLISSRLNDFKMYKGRHPITPNAHSYVNASGAKINYYMSPTSIFGKWMLNGWEGWYTEQLIATHEDDRVNTYIMYANGYEFLPSTKYSLITLLSSKYNICNNDPHRMSKTYASSHKLTERLLSEKLAKVLHSTAQIIPEVLPTICNTPEYLTDALMWYKNDHNNWGDHLVPTLYTHMTGKQSTYTTFNSNVPSIASVGSILHCINNADTVIWGSGFISDTYKMRVHPKKVCAVRGPLSRTKLISQGIDCPEIYGDPALLLPNYYNPVIVKTHTIGIIPHYVDKKHPWITAMRNNGVKIIDVSLDTHAFIDEVKSCDKIVSSSLHGLITADAYNIPNARITLSDAIVGGDFKFNDYYAGVNKQTPPILKVNINTTEQDLLSIVANWTPISIDLHKLYDSCPFMDKLPYTDNLVTNECCDVSTSLAVYTTVNNNYIKYAITCFESFRINSGIPGLKFYVFCSDATETSKNNLARYDINLVELDLSDQYKISVDNPYPTECFWLFACPERLYSLGHSHSLYVDADIMCNRQFDIDWLSNVKCIAGVNRGSTVEKFLGYIQQLPALHKNFKLTQSGLNKASMNTGVVFFNNKYCYDSGFANKILNLFRHSMSVGIARRSDDSLLALYMAVFDNLDVFYLSSAFNDFSIFNACKTPKTYDNTLEPILAHFVNNKPWKHYNQQATPISKLYMDKWLALNTRIGNKLYDELLVVTLTSWSKRITNCTAVVQSILQQSIKPDAIYLNLSVVEFPNKEKDLPVDLVELSTANPTFIINWVMGPNTKTFKKIFPILDTLTDDDIIIYTDDDIILPVDFIKSRLTDFAAYNKTCPITGTIINTGSKSKILHDKFNIPFMQGSLPTGLITKRMLANYKTLLSDAIIHTNNDDLIYTLLVFLNGYKYMPCTDYSLGVNRDTTNVKQLKFTNDNDALINTVGGCYSKVVPAYVDLVVKHMSTVDMSVFNQDRVKYFIS